MARTTSADRRPRIDISHGAKARLREIRKELRFSMDTDVIAYLLEMYEVKKNSITLAQDEEVRRRAAELNAQQIL